MAERIETDRLILRPWTADDLEDFNEYAKKPNVGPPAGWEPHKDITVSKEILDSYIKNDKNWAIEYKQANKAIGSLTIREDYSRVNPKSRSLSYVISDNYWGMGIAAEAAKAVISHVFDTMNIDILAVSHFPHNSRSKRVIEKCGFVFEGILRKAVPIYDGNVFDTYCYSMTREEYEKLES